MRRTAELKDVQERIATELDEQRSKAQKAEIRSQGLEKQLRESSTATKGNLSKTKEVSTLMNRDRRNYVTDGG